MYEIRMSAGNNLKAWYEGLVGGSDSAAMYVVVYRDKCMINFALQHCTSYLLNLICRCVCVCVGWKKVKQDFEELYKAQVWPVTLLCFGLRSDIRFIHFPGIKQRLMHLCCSVLLCATSQFAKTCEIWRRIQQEVWIQSDTSWRACWVESAVVWKLKVEKFLQFVLELKL